jgi:hypothetical protein
MRVPTHLLNVRMRFLESVCKESKEGEVIRSLDALIAAACFCVWIRPSAPAYRQCFPVP